jgi:DNA invertase Pin-like site-specific DNA recombinase
MHPKIQAGPVGIYARFSTDLQSERSIEDQVRRCREYISLNGGDPEAATVFPDFAVSGASLDRPGFEAMMAAVNVGKSRRSSPRICRASRATSRTRRSSSSASSSSRCRSSASRTHRLVRAWREDGVHVQEPDE